MKKFELTNEVMELGGKTLYRIKALRDIGDSVQAGDLGGWIEKESNLSQKGECWVRDDAKVYGNAEVCSNAKVYGGAKVCDNAWVYGDAKVHGSAIVYGNAEVCDDAEVYGNAIVYGNAEVCSNAKVYGGAKVCDNAWVCESSDILTISPIGSRNGTTTFYRTKDRKIFVKCGCKNADIDTWLEMVKETHGDNKHAQAYRLAAEIARLQILGEKA